MKIKRVGVAVMALFIQGLCYADDPAIPTDRYSKLF